MLIITGWKSLIFFSKIINYFCKTFHLQYLRVSGLWITLYMNLVQRYLRQIYEISKSCYQETQKNENKPALFSPVISSSKNFLIFQGKQICGTTFWNKVAGYLKFPAKVFVGNLWNFQNRFYKKHPQMVASATEKRFEQNIFFKKKKSN